ncbi:gliding motility protein GldM [Parafilimonas sp.]|uniref:type IX secretion system motor protein PorM/GldM n=1 Tax=Parafilimonas sp. TaxID=1969739 RepID=UPI0039E6BC45
MALPKEPRQKMINLMYLVLTALLALNVSAEILNAFKTVDHSLTAASATLDQKNKNIFAAFSAAMNDESTKARASEWMPKAQQAQKMSDLMIEYIRGLKTRVIGAADWNPKDSTFKEDDLEAPTRVMTDPGKAGDSLHLALGRLRTDLLNLIDDPAAKQRFGASLPIDTTIFKTNNKANQKDWAASYFYMTPAVAAVTILSKFENDVKNSEAMIVDYCYQQVGAVKQVFNTYQPLVGQSSNYVMPGQEITLTAGIGAYNADSKPTVTVDGATAPLNANGVAEYKFTAGGAGSYTKHVVISYFNQSTGKQEQATYDMPVTVGSPTGASVSADAVKVFYVGLENPITVSGGNVGDEKVSVSLTNGSLSKTGPGKYIVRPGKAGTPAVVTVNADGKASTFEFKVKDVPDPIGKVGINKGGRMRVNDFKAQPGVRADLENFVFEGVKFNVTAYTIVLTGAGFPQLQFRDVKGASFSSIRDLIEKCKPGSTVTIDNIAAAGPGGTRILPPIVFNLY